MDCAASPSRSAISQNRSKIRGPVELGAEPAEVVEPEIALEAICIVRGLPMPVIHDRRMGCCSGRGQMLTGRLAVRAVPRERLVLPPREHELEVLVEAGPHLDRRDAVVDVRVVGSPTGNPATSRPPLMVSIIAYSSATRTGSRVLPSDRPIGKMAVSRPSASVA